MAFRKKRKQKPIIANPQDKQVHRTFQIGAVLLMLYIAYTLYFDKTPIQPIAPSKNISEEELNSRVKAAIDRMSQTPEFKRIKGFIDSVEGQGDKEAGNVLIYKGSTVLYIPGKLLNADKNEVKISSDKYDFTVNISKKDTIPALKNEADVPNPDKNSSGN